MFCICSLVMLWCDVVLLFLEGIGVGDLLVCFVLVIFEKIIIIW